MATLKMILHFQAMNYSKAIEENNSLKERLTAIEELLYKILEEKMDKEEKDSDEEDEDEEDEDEEDEAQEDEDKVGSE